MVWQHLVSYFFAGVFLTNAIPHFISGVMGRAFQSPFADPPGRGLSPPTTNVLWGFFNAVVGYILIARIGEFDWRLTADVIALGAGSLLMALFAARHFGRLDGRIPPPHS